MLQYVHMAGTFEQRLLWLVNINTMFFLWCLQAAGSGSTRQIVATAGVDVYSEPCDYPQFKLGSNHLYNCESFQMTPGSKQTTPHAYCNARIGEQTGSPQYTACWIYVQTSFIQGWIKVSDGLTADAYSNVFCGTSPGSSTVSASTVAFHPAALCPGKQCNTPYVLYICMSHSSMTHVGKDHMVL